MNEEVLNAMQRYADDELRSLTAQIEYVCREALRQAGRWPAEAEDTPEEPSPREGSSE